MPDSVPLAKGLSDALPSGDNVIGRVKLTDGTDVLLVNTDGTISVGTIRNCGLLVEGAPGSQSTLTVKRAVISCSASGDNTLVVGVSSKKLRVISYVLSAAAQVNAKFQSSTAGDISGLIYMAQYGGAVAGENPTGWFETAAGEDLQLNLSGNVAVGGHLSYVEAA